MRSDEIERAGEIGEEIAPAEPQAPAAASSSSSSSKPTVAESTVSKSTEEKDATVVNAENVVSARNEFGFDFLFCRLKREKDKEKKRRMVKKVLRRICFRGHGKFWTLHEAFWSKIHSATKHFLPKP